MKNCLGLAFLLAACSGSPEDCDIPKAGDVVSFSRRSGPCVTRAGETELPDGDPPEEICKMALEWVGKTCRVEGRCAPGVAGDLAGERLWVSLEPSVTGEPCTWWVHW